MTVLTANLKTTAAYIVSEDIFRSREQVMLRGTAKVEAGTVLGRIDSTAAATAAAKSGGNTGNGTISAVTTRADVKPGVYRVEFTAATKFDVIDPEGIQGKSGSTGVAYADDLGFTITAGGTPFVAGDAFDITVVLGADIYGPLDFSAVNGLQNAAAILFEARTPANNDDKRCVISARSTEVVDAMLTWPAGMTAAQKSAAKRRLAANHIILR